jgi:uncharacterized protein
VLNEKRPARYNWDMTSRDMELIRAFKARLDQRLTGYRLIVFGSRARGDADEESDLDVLVITEEPEKDELFLEISGCAWEASMELGAEVLINTVVASKEAWETGPERLSLLALAVQREGVPV